MSDAHAAADADRAAAVWPTLDADRAHAPDRAGGPDEPDRPPKRICIATPDILGPIRNGGIGTAYHHLARQLAAWGHEVTIAYVNYNAADAAQMAAARALYARHGVAFEPVVPRPAAESALARVPAPGWTLLDWLRARERDFDIVHVPDWHGLGYGALLARSLGLAFGATHFVVIGHSPSLWATEGGRQLVHTEAELGWVFMERRSVELADTFISVSTHLVEWMRDAGYALPPRSFVWPNAFPPPDPAPAAAAARAARDGAPLEEVVFFGRLEPRKGLLLFIDAVDRLARRGRAPARVTFLGGRSPRIDGPELIRSAARRWPAAVRTITGADAGEAVAHLARPGRLAVIPSLQENCSMAVLECLQAGIPFVAAATGGTPELIDPADHARALVAPDYIALGDRLAELAAAPLRAVRPARGFDRVLDVWRRWHAQSAPFDEAARRFAARAASAAAETPPVTVCLVHHERPALLRMAADSALAQDYPNLDAVLVDDGSESPAALAALEQVEADFAARGWRTLRQENRYCGAARNTAARAARGEWLLFLDDDNVLFPDAVSRLVRAARFAGADCVPAASIRFTGDGDPRAAGAALGTPIRFLGAARAWSHIDNVVGDACALVRRDVFEAVGGFTEEYRVGLDDLALYNRLIRDGRRIEPLPDPVYYYRTGVPTMKQRNRSAEAARRRVLAPYLDGLPADERAFGAYACQAAAAAGPPAGDRAAAAARPRPDGCVMALARRPARLGAALEASVLLDAAWLAEARRREGRARLELRRNGRLVGQAAAPDKGRAVRIAAGSSLRAAAGALYSVHDALDGAALAALAMPARRRRRRLAGAVDRGTRRAVRGWLLDEAQPDRRRRAAIHLDGRLQAVVGAAEPRGDIARWKGTSGRHGFLWRIPPAADWPHGTRVDVFDADTGWPLSGSPLRLEDGQVVAAAGGVR